MFFYSGMGTLIPLILFGSMALGYFVVRETSTGPVPDSAVGLMTCLISAVLTFALAWRIKKIGRPRGADTLLFIPVWFWSLIFLAGAAWFFVQLATA